jgi:hypothetical protein
LRQQLRPLTAASIGVLVAWTPFLSFQVDRGWVDVRTILGAADSSGSFTDRIEGRLDDLELAVTHLGQSLHEAVWLTPVLWAGLFGAMVIAAVSRRWRDPGFALPAAMLAAGLAAQVVTDQGERTDVLLLWLLPLYALTAWATAQLPPSTTIFGRRLGAVSAASLVVVAVVAIAGSVDLARAVRATPEEHRLGAQWRAARAAEPVLYDAALHPEISANRFYLPCDPPYDWGSEIWYLQEVLRPGAGNEAAAEGGAFRARPGPPCASR